MKYNSHCKCGKKLDVPIWKYCFDCSIKRNKEYQKKYREKMKKNKAKDTKKERIRQYQKEYYSKHRLRNKKYRDDKKKYYEIDKNNIKYYIVDEQYNIIGYKLHDNGMTNTKEEFLKSAS